MRRTLRSFIAVLGLLAALLAWTMPAQACTSAACLTAGPRLASISSTRGPLLNALLNTLGGGSINLSAADWSSIAAGEVSLARTVSALQTTLSVSTPQQALAANATVAQIVGAMATAAQQESNSVLAGKLTTLQGQISLPTAIKLGDLVVSDGVLGTTRVNALGLVTGAIQLYNRNNVATTPTPISLSGNTLGLAGVLNSVQLQAQVIEAPVYVCGPLGSTFHSAALRVKLHLDLLSIGLNLGIFGVSASVGQLDLYLEIARADGVLTAVDAIANTLTVQATPGLVGLYVGTIADNVFFNRSRALVATDVTPGNIGSLTLLTTTVAIRAKAVAIGQAPMASTLNFSGTGLQTRTAYTSANFATNLIVSLVDNLQLSLSPSGLLDYLLSSLSPVLVSALKPVLTTLLTGLIDPLLELLGVRIGEVDVTSGGTVLSCTVSGSVYQDSNHSARQDSGETGTGLALYAKLVATATPTVATAVVSVDPTSGSYSFSSVLPAGYAVVISTDGTAAQVTAVAPAGWVGTEAPSLTRSVTVSTAHVSGQRFGLYHGSKLSGSVFKDTGIGSGGIAHNGVRDGTEPALAAAVLNLTDSAGTTVYDSTLADSAGAYTLWLPFSTHGAVLKVTQPADATAWVSVSGRAGTTGGTYALATDTLSFTHATGSIYTGVDFGDVPVNRLDSDGQMMISPGATALFPHVLHAGSAGQVTLSLAAVGTAPAGWSAVLFRDTGCDGRLDAVDTPIGAALTTTPEQDVCLIVKVFAPANAPMGARYALTLNASFAYANISLVRVLQRQDQATIAAENGLRLVKVVDRSSAGFGDVIVYTLTIVNDGAGAVTALKVRDATPAYTTFVAASCGTLPAGLACVVTTQPGVGAAGSVEWTLTGTLLSSGSVNVTLSVKLN
jgi:uncharacterized repeat protein (TIGR01451 family)